MILLLSKYLVAFLLKMFQFLAVSGFLLFWEKARAVMHYNDTLILVNRNMSQIFTYQISSLD